MITKVLNHGFTQGLLVSLIFSGAFLCIFTPNYLFFNWGIQYAFQIMLGYLFLGFFFLVINQSKLMFTSFACCAGLCLFMKYNTNEAWFADKRKGDAISIAHFNVANSNDTKEETMDEFLQSNADIISFQEVTPDWEEALIYCLRDEYPFHFSVPDIGIMGMAIYSKFPFEFIDTFHHLNVPNIIGCVKIGREDVCLIGSHTYPAFDKKTYSKLLSHFESVANKIKTIDSPVITFGDYNTVGWSDEIQNFRQNTDLNDSRRGFMPTYPHGSLTFFEVPLDHIFYSDQFICSDFKTLSGSNTRHLGIMGTFELISSLEDDITTEVE